MKIKPGSGFWDTTKYPFGGCFDRAPRNGEGLAVAEIIGPHALAPRWYDVRLADGRTAAVSVREIDFRAMTVPIGTARRGDVIRFKAHALRIETEPLIRGNRIRLEGRENRDGCPYVSRWYFSNLAVSIEREKE